MYNFVYDGSVIDDMDINESVSYKIEDNIMTLYEDGRLVDSATVFPGNRIRIDISEDESAQIFIEAKVDEEKGMEVLRSFGLTDEQINAISTNEDYSKFINILRDARKEVEIDSVKEVLRSSLGMNDEQINSLIEKNGKDFSAFTRIVNKGKKVVEKDAANAADTVDPNATVPADPNTSMDTTTPTEDPNAAAAPVDPNAAPATDTTTEPAPAEQPAEGENSVPPTPVTGTPSETQPEENGDQNTGEIQPTGQETSNTEANPVPEQNAEASANEPDTDDNTAPGPEETEESVLTEDAEGEDIIPRSNADEPSAQTPITVDGPSSDVEEDSASTIGAMLPQMGGNEFNMNARAGTDVIPNKAFSNKNVVEYVEDIDAEYTDMVEEGVKEIADKIKTGVELSMHIRKLAIDIAVLNSKLYVAKRYSDNKLKAINIERRMLKLQHELNTIKSASSTEEKAAIMKLQKEAFKKAKEEAIKRAEKRAAEKKAKEAEANKAPETTEVKKDSVVTSAFKRIKDNKDTKDVLISKATSDAPAAISSSEDDATKKKIAAMKFKNVYKDPAGNIILYSSTNGKFYFYDHEKPFAEWSKNILTADSAKKKIASFGEWDAFIKDAIEESVEESVYQKLYNEAKVKYEETGDRRFYNKMRGYQYFLAKESALDGEGFTNFDEAKDMEDEIKPIVDVFNKKGYKVKYASPGHLKLRKVPDTNHDGVYKGKLYTDARVQFDKNYNMPEAPKGWFFKNIDNMDYLDVKEISYDSKKGSPDDAFKKWKSSYIASLKAYADSLDNDAELNKDAEQPEDTKEPEVKAEESVTGFENFYGDVMDSFGI